MSWVEFKIAIAKGLVASAESVANIISGATKVGNADKLDDKHASDFVLLQNFIAGNMGSKCVYYPATIGKDCDTIDDFLALANGADGLHYPIANVFYYIITLKYSETEKKQIALDYNGYKVYERHSRGGVWNDWKTIALTSDSAKVIVSTTAPADTTAVWIVP